MKKAKIVVLAERNNLMKKDSLWLTSGGRVVKPGWGEYAREDWHDIPLLREHELESGITLKEFNTRWQAAVKQWKKWRRSVTKGTKK